MGSDIGSVIAGLINSQNSLPTVDIQSLLNTIQQNQQNNNQSINALPASVQALLNTYQNSTNNAYNTATTGTNTIGNNLLNQTTQLYGPNTPAVQATLAALKQNDYSTLPGTLNNLKSQLAATGGLQRGGAANAITKAVLNPATQFSQQAANTQGQQLQAQQSNVQQALNKIASMSDATLQQVLGMTQQQAQQILSTGNQALQTQLADLINSNNFATNATLGAEGLAANNGYQNAVTRNNQNSAIVNGLVNAGVDASGALIGGFGGSNGGTDFNTLAGQGLASTPPSGSNYAPGSSYYNPG